MTGRLSSIRRRAARATVAALLVAAPAFGAEETPGSGLDSSTLAGLVARAIGPANMSGRVAALDATTDAAGNVIVYVGAASGGVWKSKDGGITFEAIFDKYPQSIGAISIDPADDKVIWIGTGESWVRNSVSVGRGVYRSSDGGDTWELLGLEGTERIASIRIHPKEPKTVWVCATGHLWNDHAERGVFKTTDGGKTWKKVLYVDEKTGCSDLDLDQQDPNVLFAGMWQFRRQPHFFTSGGPGSALYRSTDGGETWHKLAAGLPEGEKGRIAVAVAPSRSSRVYATVEAKETALYRSDNLGETWKKVNSSFNVTARPFYFSHLVVDPNDHRVVYKAGLTLALSTDSGESFTSPFSGGGFGGGVHPDQHAIWVNPKNSRHVIIGNDGGAYVSYDQSRTFRHIGTLPLSQFYKVSVDSAVPYNVYGGLQDNGSWMGPSRSVSGVENRDWNNVGGGDGFATWRDPADPDYVYSEYQGGQISRVHLPTSEVRDIKPHPAPGKPKYRFNWNTPMVFSPHQLGTVYLGSQILLRSQDRGESWEEISPDLTTNDPAKQRQKESGGLTTDNSTAENHTTIFAIDESPKKAGVIWAGTDDGNLQVTNDDGKTWTNVVANVPSLPKNTWVSSVTASPHDAQTAFATFDGHTTGDLEPHVYRTTDLGKTWTSLASAGLEGYAHIVRQDPVNPALLYLGTEFGLWMSVDGGTSWARFEGNFPKMVAVRDLAIHTQGDLVVATHGRGIYILDDLAPLRGLTASTLEQEVAILPTRPAELTIPAGVQNFGGAEQFAAPNPPEAVQIAYYLKKRHVFGDLKIEVYGDDGKLITSIPGTKRKGLNRVEWAMRLPPPKLPPATNLVGAFQGPRVLEGSYKIKLIKGKESLEGTVRVVNDPRSKHSAQDRRLQQTTALDLYKKLERLTYLVDAATDARDQARERVAKMGERDKLRKAAEVWATELENLRTSLVSTNEAGWLSGDEKLREELGNLFGLVEGFTGRPSKTQLDQAAELSRQLETAYGKFGTVTAKLPELNAELAKKGAKPVEVMTEAAWQERQKKGGGKTAARLAKPVPTIGYGEVLRRLAEQPVWFGLR
jgi:photosystem II stability/assembly factor-like uncharacterized protein